MFPFLVELSVEILKKAWCRKGVVVYTILLVYIGKSLYRYIQFGLNIIWLLNDMKNPIKIKNPSVCMVL